MPSLYVSSIVTQALSLTFNELLMVSEIFLQGSYLIAMADNYN